MEMASTTQTTAVDDCRDGRDGDAREQSQARTLRAPSRQWPAFRHLLFQSLLSLLITSSSQASFGTRYAASFL